MTDQIDIFYGIGAAKSGTSWLHDYYAGHPECHIRSLKELFWFCRTPGADDAHARDFRRHLVRAVSLPAGPDSGARAMDRARRARALFEWFDYLDRPGATDADYRAYVTLRMDRRPGARMCADITPKYAFLDERGFERMARQAKVPRFVFLMRDPVDRLWSHCRMLSKVAEKRQNRLIPPETFARAFLRGDAKRSGEAGAYGDYAGTLSRLIRAVGRDAVHVGFHETLTEAPQIRALNRFLGLSHVAPDAARRVNAGREGALDPALRGALGSKLAPQYDYVAGLTGVTVPDRWRASVEVAA